MVRYENTVVLMTRERAHDIGVFKAVGMTPRQTIAMVVTTVAATGLIAWPDRGPGRDRPAPRHPADHGQRRGDGLPPGVYNVYSPPELMLLALTGLVIAVVSALAPAGWAARIRTAISPSKGPKSRRPGTNRTDSGPLPDEIKGAQTRPTGGKS